MCACSSNLQNRTLPSCTENEECGMAGNTKLFCKCNVCGYKGNSCVGATCSPTVACSRKCVDDSNVKTCSCSASRDVADTIECHECDRRCVRCGSKDLAGGASQYCECVREHFKCAREIQCTGPSEALCDANDALGGSYAQHCPELCAAFLKATTKNNHDSTATATAIALAMDVTNVSFAISFAFIEG
jgi:hypothetical protein